MATSAVATNWCTVVYNTVWNSGSTKLVTIWYISLSSIIFGGLNLITLMAGWPNPHCWNVMMIWSGIFGCIYAHALCEQHRSKPATDRIINMATANNMAKQ